jgi:hypothetical protein
VKLSERLSQFGPGLLLAATGIGVGDMVSSTIAGAEYGLTLVWALVFGVIIKFAITEGAARWQLATGATLIEGWREVLPTAAIAAFFIYFVIWSYFVSARSSPPARWCRPPSCRGAAAGRGACSTRWPRCCGVVRPLRALSRRDQVVRRLKFVPSSRRWRWSWRGRARLVGDWRPLAVLGGYTLSLVGGVGGRSRCSHAYWMREAGWTGLAQVPAARTDLTLSFALVFIFCFSMIFLSTQIEWTGQILEEGPRLCLLLADRIGREVGPIGRGVFLLGFWGAAFSSVLGVYHGVPFLFDDMLHVWRRRPAWGGGAPPRLGGLSGRGRDLGSWCAARCGGVRYTVVDVLPFVISTLLWLNNSSRLARSAERAGQRVLGTACSTSISRSVRCSSAQPAAESAFPDSAAWRGAR